MIIDPVDLSKPLDSLKLLDRLDSLDPVDSIDLIGMKRLDDPTNVADLATDLYSLLGFLDGMIIKLQNTKSASGLWIEAEDHITSRYCGEESG